MPPPPATAAATPLRPWARFRRAHLFDYTPAALRAWLAIALAGALAAGWALLQLARLEPADQWIVLVGLAATALAASFATQIPRTTHSLSVSDVFVFTLLATLGPPAAVLAAGIDGCIGTLRTSRRLSSRVATPAAAMAAMSVCGALFGPATAAFAALGLQPGVATVAALCSLAIVPFALTMVPLLAMMAWKRGEPLAPLAWLRDSAWMAATVLGAALVAGLLHLNAQHYGMALLVVAGAAALALVLLLRVTLLRREAERSAQEARVAEAEREAEAQKQRFTAAFTHAAIGMAIVCAREGRMLQVNQALAALVGQAEGTLVGQPFASLLHPGDEPLFRRQVHELDSRQDQPFSMELRCLAADGSESWVALHCSRYDDPAIEGPGLIYQLHDITSRHVAESRLQHIAFHDSLTDLANRSCFHERLEVAVEKSRVDAEHRFAVAFLDLDRFKIVNDSLGHIAGNHLLREVALRLRQCVRPSDLVARLGGDEFAILLDGVHGHGDGMRLAERVLRTLMQPVSINGTEVVPGASVGITFSDLGYRTVDEVLRDADLAMYEAKAAGRGRVVLFDNSMHERVAEKLALEADLRHAIGDGQLSVHFQPIYELDPYRLAGFEALARWTHPLRGPVSPAVFIQVAEESGHIETMTDWMIEHSVAQLARWQRDAPGHEHLGVQVNISGRDLARESLVPHVQAVLERHRLPPGRLTLEITETMLMDRLDVALATLGQLRALGVRLAIDDFGTGYSSLAYLSTLPIDSLKIDRSFVMGLVDQPQNVEIVRAVLNLGTSLGRRVVAEGIETTEQLAVLRRLGVPVGQGYLLSRPLRADQVPALLATATGADYLSPAQLA